MGTVFVYIADFGCQCIHFELHSLKTYPINGTIHLSYTIMQIPATCHTYTVWLAYLIFHAERQFVRFMISRAVPYFSCLFKGRKQSLPAYFFFNVSF